MANTFVFDDDEPQPEMNTSAPEPNEPEQPEGGEGSNRTFLFAAIGLGGIVLISLICMAVYALLILPGQKANAKMTEDANAVALAQTATADGMTQVVAMATATELPTETPTFAPTETPVVVFATSTPLPVFTSDPATATVEALQTQLALSQATAQTEAAGSGTPGAGTPGAGALGAGTPGSGTPGTATSLRGSASGTPGTPGAAAARTSGTPGAPGTELAKTGFADEVGLPGLFIVSLILVAVIWLARRLRQTPIAR